MILRRGRVQIDGRASNQVRECRLLHSGSQEGSYGNAGGNYPQYEKENDGYADDLAVMGYPGLGHRLLAPGCADLIRFDKRQTGGWCDHLAGKTGPASCRR
jgi:hypothetical protein